MKNQIIFKHMEISPRQISIQPHQPIILKISYNNQLSMSHMDTSNRKFFFAIQELDQQIGPLAQGQSYTFQIKTPGIYNLQCTNYPKISAQIHINKPHDDLNKSLQEQQSSKQSNKQQPIQEKKHQSQQSSSLSEDKDYDRLLNEQQSMNNRFIRYFQEQFSQWKNFFPQTSINLNKGSIQQRFYTPDKRQSPNVKHTSICNSKIQSDNQQFYEDQEEFQSLNNQQQQINFDLEFPQLQPIKTYPQQQQPIQQSKKKQSSFQPQVLNNEFDANLHKTNNYSVYCSRRGKQSSVHNPINYASNLILIDNFNTLEHFFALHKRIKSPSQCQIDTKIFYFKQQCKPYWQQWLDSGCLLFQLKNNHSEIGVNFRELSLIDHLWEVLLFNFIGNMLHNDVIGFIANKRDKITLIQIWLSMERNSIQIGTSIENILKKQARLVFRTDAKKVLQQRNLVKIEELDQIIKIKFKKHKDSINTRSTIKGAHDIHKNKKKSNHGKMYYNNYENTDLNITV